MSQTVLFVNQNAAKSNAEAYADVFAEAIRKPILKKTLSSFNLEKELEVTDIILIICEISNTKPKGGQIKRFLKLFRDVRLPYVFVKEDTVVPVIPKHIFAPVSFLPEEKEKASWGSSLGGLFDAKVNLFQPKDRGTRAKKNITFIQNFLQKTNVDVAVFQSGKPSAKIEFDVLKQIPEECTKEALFIISASRDYGLDDLFFGPKEFHVVKKATVPVMVINPRGDIYVLCGD